MNLQNLIVTTNGPCGILRDNELDDMLLDARYLSASIKLYLILNIQGIPLWV